MSRSNQWFVPGEGIAREVITADIQRYLGPDALVRPGSGTGDFEVRHSVAVEQMRSRRLTGKQGRPGYWITAYRTLTSVRLRPARPL
jgi:hypothetical protein